MVGFPRGLLLPPRRSAGPPSFLTGLGDRSLASAFLLPSPVSCYSRPNLCGFLWQRYIHQYFAVRFGIGMLVVDFPKIALSPWKSIDASPIVPHALWQKPMALWMESSFWPSLGVFAWNHSCSSSGRCFPSFGKRRGPPGGVQKMRSARGPHLVFQKTKGGWGHAKYTTAIAFLGCWPLPGAFSSTPPF